jgi:hypothetical protein
MSQTVLEVVFLATLYVIQNMGIALAIIHQRKVVLVTMATNLEVLESV